MWFKSFVISDFVLISSVLRLRECLILNLLKTVKTLLNTFIIILIFLFSSNKVSAQADTLIKFCSENMGKEYISDGQHYMALLSKGELAEFRTTFYSDIIYRVAVCCGLSNDNVDFTIYDTKRNRIFANKDYNNISYWDFSFSSTTDCIIEAQINADTIESGILILLIGFKPNK